MMVRTSLAVLVAIGLFGCNAHTPDGYADEGAHPPHWSYTDAGGPAGWSRLAPEYALCIAGSLQSPLDLGAAVADPALPDLRTSYSAAPASVSNNGHTIQASFGDAGSMHWGDRQYTLMQMHHHRPSEHTVDGRQADLEVHLVHRAPDGSLAVIGAMFDEGPSAAPVIDALIAGGTPGHPAHTDIDPGALLPADLSYVTYEGSLTTPPCTEGVRWIVLRERGSVSAAQLRDLSALLAPNSRPVAPVARRTILHTQAH